MLDPGSAAQPAPWFRTPEPDLRSSAGLGTQLSTQPDGNLGCQPRPGLGWWLRGSRRRAKGRPGYILLYARRVVEPKAAGAPSAPAGSAESLVGLIARGVLDAELAALVWILVEARIPLVIAAPPGRAGAGGELLAAILASIHPEEQLEPLLAPLGAAGAASLVRGRRAGGVMEAASLGEVRERLGGGPLPLTEDQLTFLGCVLVVGGAGRVAGLDAGAGEHRAGRLRVTAAHYVRPLARDAHGHSQRLDPAVLATWDPRLERYEHFAWGVIPEIAARLGWRTGDLEADLHHRRDDLAGLAKAGVTSLDEVRRLVAGYRVGWGAGHGGPHDGGAETAHPPH